jgi:hypothetical protein
MKASVLLIFLTLMSTQSYGQKKCTNLEYDQSNTQDVFVSGIACNVIKDSYPELLNVKIKIVAIEDNKLLSSFSKGRLSFISFFNLKHLVPFSKSGYLLGYSRIKVFESSPSPSNLSLTSVIAHELAHTLRWKRLGAGGSIVYAAYTTLGNEKVRGKYERSIDIMAIYYGIQSNSYYAQGLADYRQWNYLQTSVEKREYLKQVYYFEDQLTLIEDLGRSINDRKRAAFFKELSKQAPIDIEAIQNIYNALD